MIHRFRKVADGVYRGSAPSPKDVQELKNNFGIKKIISLDANTGNHIDRVCKLLGIQHVMLPIDGTRKSLLKFLNQNIKKLLIDGGPTYFHCRYGKDRTGLLAAMFKCKYAGMSPESAIKEAKSLGFGTGVDPKIVNLYEKIIKNCKPVSDNNDVSIVDNEREYKVDNRDTFLDSAQQNSFSPYETKQYPYDNIYNPINDQFPTRKNKDEPIKEHIKDNMVPMIGKYDNAAGLYGAGPVFPAGGFISD